MSNPNPEDDSACQVCLDFEPQAWRKSLCRNCFHSLDEHSHDLLAAEAEAVAKEIASKDGTLEKPTGGKSDPKKSIAPNAKVKDSGKATPWSTDSLKRKNAPSSSSASSASAPAVAPKSSPKSSLSSPSSKSSSSSSTTTNTSTPASSTSSKAGTPSSSNDTSTKSATISKAKSLSSKFEAKAASSVSDKSSKSQDSPKATDSSKLPSTKTDPKAKHSVSNSKLLDKSQKSEQTKTKDDVSDKKDASKTVGDVKDKKAPLSSKVGDKNGKDVPNNRSKAAPFGKDMLRSTKEVLKKETKISDNGSDKTKAKESATDTSKSTPSKHSIVGEKEKTPAKTPVKSLTEEKSKKKTEEIVKDTGKVANKVTEDTGKVANKVTENTGKVANKVTEDSGKVANKVIEDTGKVANKVTENTGKVANNVTEDSGKVANKVTDKVDASGEAPCQGSEHTNNTDTRSLTSAGKKVIPGAKNNNKPEKNVDPPGKLTQSISTDVGEISDTSVQPATENESRDVTQKVENNKRDDKKPVCPPVVSNKLPDNEKSGLYKDRGKDEGGGGDNGLTSCSQAVTRDDVPPAVTVGKFEGDTGTPHKLPISSNASSSVTSSTPATPSSSSTTAVTSTTPKQALETKNNLDCGKEKSPSVDKGKKDLCKDSDNKNDNGSATTSISASCDKIQVGELVSKSDYDTLTRSLEEKDERFRALEEQVSKMEDEMKKLEEEKQNLQQAQMTARKSQKDDMEKLLQELRAQLNSMSTQCEKLQTDNQTLQTKLHGQEETIKRDQETRGKNVENTQLEEDLELAEKELEEVKDENKEFQSQIMEMKNEMDEMYDHFRENEHEEFRELQKELDLTAKNCRILQFKLRKSERRNDQIEEDRVHYEEKLRQLQDQFDSQDAKHHIRVLEEELRVAKEVSVRLHDELDIVEDRRNKALEENRHLTELLEHTDKRQFRLEMEIDKLRDVVSDLKMQLRESKGGNNNNKDSSPDRKPPPLGTIGKQGSKEYDVSQLMKDLYDCMERENDLKDQLKFTEEEAKMMRKRVSETDEENENLRLQLLKMSEKASKHKKKEQETQKSLEEERTRSEAVRAALTTQLSHSSDHSPLMGDAPYLQMEPTDDVNVSADVILVVGGEGSNVFESDEPIPVTNRKDSTDEDLMNVMQMRMQLEIMEQELMTSQKKFDDLDLENENLQAEVKFLQERLEEKTQDNRDLPETMTPSAFYEDKLDALNEELDDLRWKLIEKDRELERLEAVQSRHGREHGHSKKTEKLKKSKSLEDHGHDALTSDLKRHLEHAQMEMIQLKVKLEQSEDQNKVLTTENDGLKSEVQGCLPTVQTATVQTAIVQTDDAVQDRVPTIKADDAALVNVDLRDKLEKVQEENCRLAEKMKNLTESLQRLSRDTRSIATSPTSPGIRTLLDPKGEHTKHTFLSAKSTVGEEGVEVQQEQSVSCKSIIKTEEDGALKSKGNQRAKDHGGKDKEVRFVFSPPAEEEVEVSDQELKAIQTGSQQLQQQQQQLEEQQQPDQQQPQQGPASNLQDNMAESKQKSPSPELGSVAPSSSLLEDYADGRSKVTISGDESRVELMEKVLDMDDEISDLLKDIRKREEEKKSLLRDVKSMKTIMQEVKEDSRRNEVDLLQELDMLHDKNSVMSNLLDIINERAEAAEEELEKRIQEESGQSPTRSTSNVSQVSALSDTSVGSDEVFAGHTKDGVILRDWEAKLKVRIESLERLLAEERQKVNTAEKKLVLAGIDSVSPSMTDDVKMRMREKELLQEELLKSQRHLHIATDQIQGLKERITILEEEHERLKKDYAKLYDEIDKPKQNGDDATPHTSDSDKTPENVVENELPFEVKKVAGLQQSKPVEDKSSSGEKAKKQVAKDITVIEAELAKYKEKTRELEYKVEEINDIWKSKSTASDKEKDELELQLKDKIHELNLLDETLSNLKLELCAKNKIITEYEMALKEKDQELNRRSVRVEEPEPGSGKHDDDDHVLLENQISQRDTIIKELNDNLSVRDGRLREKDDLLFKLNIGIEEQKQTTYDLEEKLNKLTAEIQEKDVMIGVLRGKNDIRDGEPASPEEVAGQPSCQTDAEKEYLKLKEELEAVNSALEKSATEKRGIEGSLEMSRQALEDAMYSWDKERNSLQRDVNILEEKVRMYEDYNVMNRDETIDSLKLEAQEYFGEKESLTCELSSVRMKWESADKTHKEQMAQLQAELSEKLRLLKVEVDNNVRINTELERLRRQAEVSYRLQQEERILRAEHLSMKVRYESRIDKMNKENNKMLVTVAKLQQELDLDKEIIKHIEKNFNALSDKYTGELLSAQEDKAALDRQMKEIDESRSIMDQVQRQMREVREQSLDQERLRAELINRFTTDRAAWEITKANMQSQINQLEEQLCSSSKQNERSKDIQVNMGMAWDKERREQRRLLQEAHTLALDLQEQLRARDEAYAHERKEHIRQMENERLSRTKDKRETDKKHVEFDSTQRKLMMLQKQLQEAREKMEKEVDSWREEKKDYLRQVAECRHHQARDRQKVEEVLTGFVQLRELATMLKSDVKGEQMEEKPPDKTETSDQKILTYVKEAVCQIGEAADELSKYANTPQDGGVSCFTGSDVQMMKDEVFEHYQTQGGTDVFLVADVNTRGGTTTCRIEQQTSVVSRQLKAEEAHKFHAKREVHAYASASPSSKSHDSQTQQNLAAAKLLPTTSEVSESKPASQNVTPGNKALHTKPPSIPPTPPVFDPRTRLHTSGDKVQPTTTDSTKSAPQVSPPNDSAIKILEDYLVSQLLTQGSTPQTQNQKNTQQIQTHASSNQANINSKQPQTPSADSVSKSNTMSPVPVVHRNFDGYNARRYDRPPSYTSGTRSAATSRAATPEVLDVSHTSPIGYPPLRSGLPDPPPSFAIPHHRSLQPKSPSTESPEQSSIKPKRPSTIKKSYSIDSSFMRDTNTYGRPSSVSSSTGTTPTTPVSSSDLAKSPISSLKAATVRENFSPRTARRKFFEEPHLFPPNTYPYGYKSLPHRKSASSSSHERQVSLPDPSEVRRGAEEDYDVVASKFDQSQMVPGLRMSSSWDEKMHHSVATESRTLPSLKQTETPVSTLSPAKETEKPKTAKDKRRFFKKASSVDSESHVGSSVAKAGASALPPGVPSGYSPSDFLAAVKGKLKPMFKKKTSSSSKSKIEPERSSSPLFIQTDVPVTCASITARGPTELPVPIPHVDNEQSPQAVEERRTLLPQLSNERSRESSRKGGFQPQQWRSRSVDRPPQMGQTAQGLWKFNETAV